jgi:DNA-binding MarR family transcriptional regulator
MNAADAARHADLQLDRFLPYRLSVLSNRISQDIARLYAARFDLTVTEWRLLAVLGRSPGLSASELAERTAMDKVAVSRAVTSLLASGRLRRRVHGGDRRRSILALSARGYQVYDQVVPLALDVERRLLAQFSAEERVALQVVLDRLEKAELSVSDDEGA